MSDPLDSVRFRDVTRCRVALRRVTRCRVALYGLTKPSARQRLVGSP